LSERARQIETALETGREPRPVEVGGVVRGVLEDLRGAYPDVDVEASLPDEAWVRALPSLRLAVESVCENACEHNDAEDPRVEVSVETVGSAETGTADGAPIGSAESGSGADGRVRIVVADNGPGLPEGDRAALREGRETALEHASGLGLWLTYWIVDGSGGELRLADAEPRGTVVEILLSPAERPHDDGAAAEDPGTVTGVDGGPGTGP